MRKQDQLNHLIKSLSPAEKKYFKQYSDARGDSKGYLSLYDALSKSDSYDSELLSKKLKKTKQNLAHEKEHLQTVLLKALRNYEGERHVETRLHNALTNIRLLHHKGQSDMALAIVNTARKEAEEYEKWETLWSLLKTESAILNGTDVPRPERIRRQMENLKQMEHATAQMDLLNRFEKLYVDMDVIFAQRTLARNDEDAASVKNMLSDPLMTATYEYITARKYQLTMLCSIHIYLGDFAACLGYYERYLELLDTYPVQTGLSLRGYFVVLNIYMAMLTLNGKYEEAYAFIGKLKEKSFEHIHYNTHTAADLVTQYTLIHELMLGKRPGYEQQGLVAVQRLKDNYKVYMAIPSLTERSAGLSNAAKICFYEKQTEECLYWIDRILEDTEPSSHPPVFHMAKMVLAMCHAELKNYTLLPYMAKNTERLLKKENAYGEVEKLTLNFLKKLPSYATEKERKAAYAKLLDGYNKLKEDTASQNTYRILNYPLWAERNM